MHSTTSVDICEKLDQVSALVLELCDIDFAELSTKISSLASQIAVQAGFAEVGSLIRKKKPVPVRRMGFNLKKLSENPDNPRWSQLQTLDFRTLIFCTLSFSAISSMPSEQFTWLVRNATHYTQVQAFPQAWIATDQIRKVIANTPRLECTKDFWKNYHQLELEVCNIRDSQDTPMEERDDSQMLSQSNVGYSPPGSPQAPKKKSADDQNLLKRKQILPEEDLHSGPGSASKQLRHEPIRNSTNVLWAEEEYYSFSFVKHERIELLPDLFLTGMKACRLWKKEKEAGGLAVTNCLSLHLPKTSNEDVFCVIRLSYNEGWNFFHVLDLGTPVKREIHV